VYYYFRIIIKMYSTAPSSSPEGGENLLPFGEVGWGSKIVLILTILLALLLGIFPDMIIRLI
jgi:NADH:ubiquinone oxidoreductase subunit 2 (subunit N)